GGASKAHQRLVPPAHWIYPCESCLTMELSHAGPRTQANPRPHGKPEALPGVGCSDLVRRSKFHHSKNLRQKSPNSQRRTAMPLCLANLTAKGAKHTKRNPRPPRNERENPQKITKATKTQGPPSFS